MRHGQKIPHAVEPCRVDRDGTVVRAMQLLREESVKALRAGDDAESEVRRR